MNLLAVDTTGRRAQPCREAGERSWRSIRPSRPRTTRPSSRAPINSSPARAGSGDLDAIAVAGGPGRFTGIRIGMAYAAVAAARLKIPALALSRLEAAAFKTPGRLVCVVVTGYREERQYQLFRRGPGAPEAAAPGRLELRAGLARRQGPPWKGGAVVFEGETGPPTCLSRRIRLSRRRLPKFEPLYLKPAGYERGKAPTVR